MGEQAKAASQSAPAANTDTLLYTAPTGRQAIVNIEGANTSATLTDTIRISIRIAGAGDTLAQYIAYDTPIYPNDVFRGRAKLMNAADELYVRSSQGKVSFTAFPLEIF